MERLVNQNSSAEPTTPSSSGVDSRPLYIPQNVTLKELGNIPAKYYWLFAVTLFAAFGFGISTDRWILQYLVPINAETAVRPALTSQPAPTNPSGRPKNAPDPRDSLRKSDDVTLIDSTQNEEGLDHIPTGRFGYVTPFNVKELFMIRNETLRVLFRSMPKWFEVHKTLQGVFIIGFLTDEDATAFDDPARRRREFNVYSYTHGEAATPVKIPLSDIASWDARDLPGIEDPSIAEITLAPSTKKK